MIGRAVRMMWSLSAVLTTPSRITTAGTARRMVALSYSSGRRRTVRSPAGSGGGRAFAAEAAAAAAVARRSVPAGLAPLPPLPTVASQSSVSAITTTAGSRSKSQRRSSTISCAPERVRSIEPDSVRSSASGLRSRCSFAAARRMSAAAAAGSTMVEPLISHAGNVPPAQLEAPLVVAADQR
jgi:hypothetical protein